MVGGAAPCVDHVAVTLAEASIKTVIRPPESVAAR